MKLLSPTSKKNKEIPQKSSKWNFLDLKNLIKFFYTLNKTPLGETGCSSSLYYLLAAQVSSFLIHSPFSNIVIHDTFGTVPLTVQYLRDLQDAMLHHWSPSTSHPNLPREAEDFPRDDKYPKDVPLPTFSAYL